MNKTEAKAKTKRKGLKITAAIVLTILALFGIFLIISAIGLDVARNNVKQTIKPVVSERQILGKENVEIRKHGDESNWTIFAKKFDSNIAENGNTINNYVKILQLSDTHLGGGFMSISKDSLAIDAVKKMVEWAKPDLIILSGDSVYPIPFSSGSINNDKSFSAILDMFDGFKIPWAFVFGNHDCEDFSTANKRKIAERLVKRSYDPIKGHYCLFQIGDTFKGKGNDIPLGNYKINIRDKDTNALVHTLFFMDSNRYYKTKTGRSSFLSHDKIHDDQIEWYKKQVADLKLQNGGVDVPSSLFIHIPLPEYKISWLKLIGGVNQRNRKEYLLEIDKNSKVKYFGGDMQDRVFGSNDVVVTTSNSKLPEYNKMYEVIKNCGSTNFVFCGHNHENNISIETEDGVRLTFSKSIDYLGYPGISKRTFARGGTLIYLTGKSGKNSNIIYQKKLRDVYIGNDLSSKEGHYKRIIDFNTEKSKLDDVHND